MAIFGEFWALTSEGKLPTVAKVDAAGDLGNESTALGQAAAAKFATKAEAKTKDDDVAALVQNGATATGSYLTNAFGDQYSRTSILYVDPANGDDTRTGLSWKKAKKTIQAAVDAAPRGAEIVLAPGGHIVGAGVTCDDNSKTLTIRGASPLSGRQHADQTFGLTHIRSGLSGDARPSFLFRVGTTSSTNIYGWTFKNLYFDAGSLLPDGACIETHGVSRALVDGVSARCLGGSAEMTRWLIRSAGGAGDDAAWWHLSDVSTYGVRLVHSRKGNYWTFDGVSVMGQTSSPRATGPALDIMGSQHNLNGLHIEGWDTGVLATGNRGLLGHGVMSEWCGTLFYLVGCRDSVIIANSSAGAGSSKVVDENGTNNMVLGAEHHKVGTTSRAYSISTYGTSPTQLSAGSAYPIYANHPVRGDAGIEILPTGTTDIAGSNTITAQYWTGTAWATWTGVETAVLSVPNDQSIAVPATHARCRFRTSSQFGWAQGLAYVRLVQSQGTDATVTFRSLGTDQVTVLKEYATTLDEIAQKRGAWASFPSSTAAGYIEVEINFGITGSQTASVRRFAVFSTEVHPNVRGRQMRGAKGPAGVIAGVAGDTYDCVGTTATDPNAGVWKYTGTSGTTGWVQLQPAVLTSPNGTKYRLGVADDGSLITTAA